MNCKEFSDLLDAFMDGTLPDETTAHMRAHASSCASCAQMLQLCRDCRLADEETEAPASFSAAWRQAIEEEKYMEKKQRNAAQWKNWLAAAAALVFVVGGTLLTRDDVPRQRIKNTAVSSAVVPSARKAAADYALSDAYEYGEYELEEAADMEAPMMLAMGNGSRSDGGGATAAAKQEKIIRSASFTLRTAAYDADLETVQNLTEQLGGRIEYLSANGDAASGQTRIANLTLRIPAQRLDEFLTGAQAIGHVTALTQEMEDVSDSYYDIQTRLDTQKEKLSRLQTLMATADKVSDLIEIESAIADAQYYIDRYTSQLKGYDGRVDYSTVRVTIREIKIEETEEASLGQRILAGLSSSVENGALFLQDMLIFLVSALPWIAGISVIVLAVRGIAKCHQKNKQRE